MIGQTSGNDLRRRRAGRLAGALGLLLALALAAGAVVPAHAQGIPPMPHGFAGTVSTLTPPQVVPEGTLVQAFLAGVKKAETAVDAKGEYSLLVKGTVADTGKAVTFKVDGVTAHQSTTWQSGTTDWLNLTIGALPTINYTVTMIAAPAGTGAAVDVRGQGAYAAGVEVDVRAFPAAGYAFVNWTATPAVAFGSATAEETSFTMPATPVAVTANFAQAYALTLSVSPAGGGSAIDVQGKAAYLAGANVSIRAQAAEGYQFVNWTATPAVVFANAGAPETLFTMPAGSVAITANFEEVELPPPTTYVLTIGASPIVGGTANAAPPGGVYQAGEVVTIQAVPASGYQFSHWTVGGGTLGNANVALTTFTMPAADVTVTATFTLSQTGGGAVCFIATAAYGSPGAEEIDVLREFRDVVLLNSSPGSKFVALYYRLSPPVAEVISESSFLQTMVRELLVDPLVWLVGATGDVWRS